MPAPDATMAAYDVVIAGGGMVGASLALQLSHYSAEQLKVLVVESFPLPMTGSSQDTNSEDCGQKSPRHNPGPVYSPSFDARSTALAYSSRLILEALGVWPMLSRHLTAINSIHVSDRGNFGSATLRNQDVDWPSLGYVVENAWLGNVLLDALRQQDNVDFLAPAAVTAMTPRHQGVDLSIQQHNQTSSVAAQVAIIADGANSGLREKLGIDTVVSDYQQTALIANVSFKEPHHGRAYERFTDQGPMALLPLTDSENNEPRSALVWSLPNDQAQQLCAGDTRVFLDRLQCRFGHRQGEFTRVGDRFSYPLKLVQAQEQVRSGIVIMGNAAHSIHPVAGQGFNLALRDCARLTKLLVAAFYRQQPLGELALLQNYYIQQHYDQRKTISFSDQLPALFGKEQWSLSLLRGMGLGLLDITPVVKSHFIHHAAGLHDGAASG